MSLVICLLGTNICSYQYGKWVYESQGIRFDESSVYLGPYFISVSIDPCYSRSVSANTLAEKLEHPCTVGFRRSATGSKEPGCGLVMYGDNIVYDSSVLRANICASEFDHAGNFIGGTYDFYTADGKWKYTYDDEDGDGLWDLWVVHGENGAKSRCYRRDGMTWVDIHDLEKQAQPKETNSYK